MDARKRPVIRLLNALMTILGVAAGGLVICAALLAWQGGGPAAPQANPPADTGEMEEDGGDDSGDDPGALGLALAARGEWSAAVEPLEAALEEDGGDPALYGALARAYREEGRDTDAAEVLRAGTEATGSEELRLPLKAVESTLELPEDQRACLDALYQALAAGDEAGLSAALEDWISGQEVESGDGSYILNPLWVETGSLTWDGERFWADYTGTGLLFWGISVFWGGISDGAPDGTGSCVTADSWYPDGAVSYLRQDGAWESGTAVGEAVFRARCTDPSQALTEYDLTATLDGTADEVITRGDVTVRLLADDAVHVFHLTIQDGALSQAPFSGGGVSCSGHSGCGAKLFSEEDSFTKTYQNPYPWGRESPYAEPWTFLNFSYFNP